MIRNIIFDLGGVIINIDYKKTSTAFRNLGAKNFDDVFTRSKQESLFDDYETGKITSDIFRKTLMSKLNLIISNQEFDNAWSAMLLDLPN